MRRLAASALIASIGAAFAAASGCSSDEDGAGGGGPPAEFCEEQPVGSAFNEQLGCEAQSRCPGDEGCTPGGDPTLRAGAAVEVITPELDHTVIFAPGREGGHQFDALQGDKCVEVASCDLQNPSGCQAVDPAQCWYLAGFGVGRPALDVADDMTVRCIVIERGETAIGTCSIDNVGWFYNEVERTREELASGEPELDAGLDLVLVGSTHVHEAIDTMGIWGYSDGASGVKKDYNAFIREKTIAALKKAHAALEPVKVQFGATRVDGHIPETDPAGNGSATFVSDVRDPVVIDDELRVIRFIASDDDATVATLINFTSHPEYGDDRNTSISSDYAHTLRKGVESGVELRGADGTVHYSQPGVGGVAIFINGALGGQVGPGAVIHTDHDGNPVEQGLERAYIAGERFAAYALEALGEGAETMETVPIGFRSREIYTDVLNTGYHIAIAQQLFDRDGEFYDPTKALGPNNVPVIRSQLAVVDIGPAQLVTVPGELHAELLLATPDGTTSLDAPYPFTPAPFHITNDPETNPDCGDDGVSYCNDGPPEIAAMDRSVVIDLHRDPAVRYRWVLGLTPDQIGYIVPEYDYKLDPTAPYLEEFSPGSHYEETNSVGTGVEAQVVHPLNQLLDSPEVVRR